MRTTFLSIAIAALAAAALGGCASNADRYQNLSEALVTGSKCQPPITVGVAFGLSGWMVGSAAKAATNPECGKKNDVNAPKQAQAPAQKVASGWRDPDTGKVH